MKKIVCFFLVFFFPAFVNASNLVLEDLKVLNGELSLPFDPLVNHYTVLLEKDEYHLDFDYKVMDGVIVSELANFDLENNSDVILLLKKEEETVEYHFQILKEEEQTLTTFQEETYDLSNHFLYQYKIYIIPSICFFLIVIVYKILFHKHKKKII